MFKTAQGRNTASASKNNTVSNFNFLNRFEIQTRPIILDSNVYILDNQRNGRILTTIAGKLGKYHLKLILPRIIIYEVSKITKNDPQNVTKKIFYLIKEITSMDVTNEIKLESKKLETKYYECHNPDSIILAMAGYLNAILVTMDRKLHRTAELEGIESYTLKDFIKNWSIEV